MPTKGKPRFNRLRDISPALIANGGFNYWNKTTKQVEGRVIAISDVTGLQTALDSKLDQVAGDARYARTGAANTFTAAQVINTPSGATGDIIKIQANGTTRFAVDVGGNVKGFVYADPNANVGYFQMGVSSTQGITLFNITPSKIAFAVRMAASQSANAFEVQDSAGTLKARISAAGVGQFNSLTLDTSNVTFPNNYFANFITLSGTELTIGSGAATLAGLLSLRGGAVVLDCARTGGFDTDGWLVLKAAGVGGGGIRLKNFQTSPASNFADGGLIYTEGGALKYRGSSGTVTTLASA